MLDSLKDSDVLLLPCAAFAATWTDKGCASAFVFLFNANLRTRRLCTGERRAGTPNNFRRQAPAMGCRQCLACSTVVRCDA